MGYWYLILVVVALYCLWKLLSCFAEYYVTWRVAFGGAPKRGSQGLKKNKNDRLYVYIAETKDMDEDSVAELYNFFMRRIDTEAKASHLQHLLKTYTYAVISREKVDGSLRGVTLFSMDRKNHNGFKFTLIRNGLMFYQDGYEGGPLFYFFMTYFTLREFILRPLTPIFVIGKCYTHKSYLLMSRTYSEHYPRPDTELPIYLKEIIADYVNDVKTPTDVYDPETLVLKREKSHVKSGVVEVTEKDLQNPYIKLFVEKNPGWQKGHQMITVSRVRWHDLLNILWKFVKRSFKAGKKHRERSDKPDTVHTT